jgi:hypothetical protein
MKKDIKQLIANRKAALVQAAEFSEAAIEELAKNELADESVKAITEICNNLDKLAKASGAANDWKVNPKWEYGTVNGMIGKFISQWVFLPDTLKTMSGLAIPASAFTAQSLEAWGKLTRCTPLGQILESVEPDLDQIQTQCQLVQVYLSLDYIDPVMTLDQWQVKEAKAVVTSSRKAAEIAKAVEEAEQAALLGLPSFTV